MEGFDKERVYTFKTGGLIPSEKMCYRYATLTAESLTIYKHKSDSCGNRFIPCENIESASANKKKRGKFCTEIKLTDGNFFIFAHDNYCTAKKWAEVLNNCQVKRELKNWVLDPSLVTLDKVIGCGAYGKVWIGSLSGSPVAVKEMHSPNKEDQIEKEIILLSKIRNPNCVRLLGIFRKPNTPKLYIVTELVEAGDLSHVLAENPGKLNELTKLKIMRDIARGMTFLHENNIIHRDLKTDNCLIRSISPDAPQLAVVADFGLSKLAPQLGTTDDTNTVGMGTPVYMAPECFGDDYTEKVDVYSFGIVMNEVFSEERPWSNVETKWNHEIHDLVDQGERPRFYFQEDKVPHKEEICRIISACWATQPKSRLAMREILGMIDSIIFDISSKSTPKPVLTNSGNYVTMECIPKMKAMPSAYCSLVAGQVPKSFVQPIPTYLSVKPSLSTPVHTQPQQDPTPLSAAIATQQYQPSYAKPRQGTKDASAFQPTPAPTGSQVPSYLIGL